MSEQRWLTETAFANMRLSFEVTRVLQADQSPQQRIDLIENPLFGKVLMLDGATQVTSADEFIYHEMMAHVPILAHGAVRDVLIVGGGDCGLAEEVLKHPGITRVVQVEIDAQVVGFARNHFAEFNAAAFADPRFVIEIADGAAFVAATDQRFDVILIDSTDPIGAGAVLFTKSFYAGLRRCLRPGGIVVTQSGVPFVQRDEFTIAIRNLARVFPIAECYVLATPSYAGGHMALGWGSLDRDPRDPPLEILAERASILATRYYTPEVHRAAFALPRYILDAKIAAIAADR
ncbi:MAG: polyamine aminopropyltransferase [Rhizobiales bacterium]|nr:polyamine aminopropyltransferase [Hyphomicrobiales bacterium]